MTGLVLASGSPRRLVLLRDAGVEPADIRVPDVDEAPSAGETASQLVRRLADAKVTAVLPTLGAHEVALAADTVVALGDVVLGKPEDDADARRMLRALSGAVVTVWTGVAVAGSRRRAATEVRTLLRMAALDDDAIDAYVATGETAGAAGAFMVQGAGAALVASRTGCWTNVVGLPICAAGRLLAPFGVRLASDGCDPAGPDASTTL